RCSLSNLQFPAIALTWCGLTSHRHRSIEPFFMSLAARDSEFRRWSGRVDRRICQTFAASPAEPGELPLGFSRQHRTPWISALGPPRVRARLQDGLGGHRVETQGLPLSLGALAGLDQEQEPGRASGNA